MKIIELKPIHQDSLIYKLIDCEKRLNYIKTEVEPQFSNMENWEVLEYKAIKEDHILNIEIYKKLIRENEKFFNEILSKYDLTVSSFLN